MENGPEESTERGDDGVAQDGKGEGGEKLSGWGSTLEAWMTGLPVGF